MKLRKVWLTSFIAHSSPVLIKKLPYPCTSCCGDKEVIMFFKWSPITANFTAYLKAICFSLTLLWMGRASIVVLLIQLADKTDSTNAERSLPLPHLSVLTLSSSLVFVSLRTQLLSPSLSFPQVKSLQWPSQNSYVVGIGKHH